MRSRSWVVAGLVFCSLIGWVMQSSASAQALADKIPNDALVYVGWKGIDVPPAGYDGSHLKAVLEASQVSELINDSLPRLISRITQENPQNAAMTNAVIELLGHVWHHPTAIYFGGIDFSTPNQPLVKFAVICDVGPDAPDVAQKVTDMIAKAGGQTPFQCRNIESLVVLSAFPFPDHIDQPLSQNKEFQTVMGGLGSDPMAAAYVDGAGAVAQIDQITQLIGQPDVLNKWQTIRETLGVGGLKHIAWTTGFDGKNWSTQAIVEAPAPRKGLLAMGDVAPLGDGLIKLIPASATMVGAGNFDLDAFYKAIDGALTKFDPNDAADFHDGVAQINQALGFDLERDLLASIGPQWAYYSDPISGGLTLINQPRDAQKLETSLSKLEQMFNAIVAQQTRNDKVTVEIRQMEVDGVHMHYAATPVISPAWAIKDGTWYAAPFPQVLSASLSRPADGKSILDNPAYQQVRKELGGPDKVASIMFIDLPKTAPEGYQVFLAFTRLYLGFGDLAGMQTPAMVVPTLPKLMAEIEPAGAISWADDAGFHLKAITPFPGAEGLGAGANLAASAMTAGPLMMAVALPAMAKARQQAQAVSSMSNLRQMGQLIQLYAASNNGQLPPDLVSMGRLVSPSLAHPLAIFFSPLTGHTEPANWNTMSDDQKIDWINNDSDYTYLAAPGRKISDIQQPSQVVAAYEKQPNRQGMTPVLFFDGHVEQLPASRAQDLISASKQQLGL